MDYAFVINVLVVDLERGVPVPVDDNGDDDGDLDVSGSGFDSDGGAPSVATTSTYLICSSVNVFFQWAC
jgi:hypothetical protein